MNLNFNVDCVNLSDVIIVGAGPASLTAAIYLRRASLNVVIIEKEIPGGKMVKTNLIENYSGFKSISGPNLSLEMFNQATGLGVKCIFSEVIDIKQSGKNFIVVTKDKNYSAKTVIVATGMVEKKLGIPGEDEFYGKGVSYCATCDGPLYKGKDVAVIGGGNSALDESLYLSDIVNKVHLIHRRLAYRGDEVSVEKIRQKKNISEHLPFLPVSIIGDSSVNSVKIKNVDTGEEVVLSVACVFPFVGFKPCVDFLKNLGFKDEPIVVNENFMTKINGLFAAGDVLEKKNRQIATAIGDGSNVAIFVKEYLTFNY